MNEETEVDTLLDHFRQWLNEAHAAGESLALGNGKPTALELDVDAEHRPVGLYRLIEEFTALRHEVKLQTKGSRGVQEQAEPLLEGLRQAIEQFRAAVPRDADAAWSAGRGVAEALTDLDEALDRGQVEIDKARRRIVEESPRAMEAALDAFHARQSWIARRFHRRYHEAAKEVFQQHGRDLRRGLFESLLEGYGLIQSRLKRALKSEKVERVACVGQPADPRTMTVLEVVDNPALAPGTVIEEVRPGYTWRGRVVRFAEVRAVQSYVPEPDAHDRP